MTDPGSLSMNATVSPFLLCPLMMPPLLWQYETNSSPGLPGHMTGLSTHLTIAETVPAADIVSGKSAKVCTVKKLSPLERAHSMTDLV